MVSSDKGLWYKSGLRAFQRVQVGNVDCLSYPNSILRGFKENSTSQESRRKILKSVWAKVAWCTRVELSDKQGDIVKARTATEERELNTPLPL